MSEEIRTIQVALWHPDHPQVLLQNGHLPTLNVPADAELPGLLRDAWGIEGWTLHDGGLALGREGVVQMQALSNMTPNGFSWGAARIGPPTGAQWQRPGWPQWAQRALDTALAGAGLARTGELRPVHQHDLVAVLQAETQAGTVYLKASDTPREAAVTALLSRALPDLLPPLLWTDPQAGLMVSASGGELLDGVAGAGAWEAAVQRLAHFQQQADAPALAALGCPAWPLAEMAGRVDALLADQSTLQGWGLEAKRIDTLSEARPAIRAAFRDLAALGLPDLPAHGDAHPRNALHGPRGSVWFDWSRQRVVRLERGGERRAPLHGRRVVPGFCTVSGTGEPACPGRPSRSGNPALGGLPHGAGVPRRGWAAESKSAAGPATPRGGL